MTKGLKITLIASAGVFSGLTAFAIWNLFRKKAIDSTVSTPQDALSVINSVTSNPPSYGVGSYVFNGLSAVTQPVVNLVTQADAIDTNAEVPAITDMSTITPDISAGNGQDDSLTV